MALAALFSGLLSLGAASVTMPWPNPEGTGRGAAPKLGRGRARSVRQGPPGKCHWQVLLCWTLSPAEGDQAFWASCNACGPGTACQGEGSAPPDAGHAVGVVRVSLARIPTAVTPPGVPRLLRAPLL